MTIDTTPEPTENAFAAPEASLTDTSIEKPVLQFERFTAWGVFGLSIITLGIYYIYWLYTRIQTANSLSTTNKVNTTLLNTYLATYIFSIIFNIVTPEESVVLQSLSLIVSIMNWVLYLFVIFNLRRVLIEIINIGSKDEVRLGPILTFFFSSLYFQYKINEAIDNQSEKASSVVK